MKAGRKPQVITDRERGLLEMLWQHGPLFVREMVEHCPEPKLHFNTIATTVRVLEEKGYVGHEMVGGSHRFFAIARKKDFRDRTLANVIRDYFDNSYRNVVSALVEEEKISADELKEILAIIENKNRK
jgi:predicted transcriptional regulator